MQFVLAAASAMGVWTVTVASFTWWLSSRFRILELNIMKAMDAHDEKDNTRFGNVYDRLARIEAMRHR